MIPGSMDAVDTGWLSEVLGAEVASVEKVTIGQGIGILGELARCTLTYAPGSSGPATVVAKLPSPHAENRGVAMHFRFYEREVRFYQELADQARIGTPRCYFAVIVLERAEFALILEDLGDGRFGDQVAGLSLEDAEAALRGLAGLHAGAWGDPKLEKLEWLLPINHAINRSAQDRYQATWPTFVDRFADAITEDERRLGEWISTRFYDVLDRLMAPPLTIGHGDFRADNLVFDRDTGELQAVCDWQIVGKGHGGAFDVAYLLGASVEPALLRANLSSLLGTYHASLVAQGVDGYDLDALIADMRLGALVCLLYPVNAADLDLANERGVALVRRMSSGYFGLATELDAASAL
jgi:hypothetical protein